MGKNKIIKKSLKSDAQDLKSTVESYMENLIQKKKDSHIYFKHQDLGFTLSELLNDKKHISLYMKLAKLYEAHYLLGIANDICERKDINNKGAYFMKVLSIKNREQKILSKNV